MVYWAGGMVHITQDSPADPVMLFSNSNVVNGSFAYKGSARKDRYSVALITYNNKEDGYKQSVEYVEDQEAIKRYGIRKTESVAFVAVLHAARRIVLVSGRSTPLAWNLTSSPLQ